MKIFYFEIFLIFLTKTPMQMPTFCINNELKKIISSAKNQSFLGSFIFSKFFQNLLILFYSIQGILFSKL